MARALEHAARLHTAYAFADQFIRPGAIAAGRLVGAVKHEQDLVLRRLAEERLVQIDHFFRFVIEKIELGAGDTEAAQHPEELLARFGRAELIRVLPEPHRHSLLTRIVDDVAALLHRPLPPDAFDDVMFESELTGHA